MGNLEKVNLLVCAPGFPTKKTIDYVFVLELCKQFAEMGVQVVVVAPQSLTKILLRGFPISKLVYRIQLPQNRSIKVHRPFYFSFGKGRFAGRLTNFSFRYSVKNVCTRLLIRPDICYGHFLDSAYSLFGYAKANRLPLFCSSGEDEITFHTEENDSNIQEFKEYLTAIISVSTKNKNELIRAKLVTASKCYVVNNAVDIASFYPRDKAPLRAKFGFPEDDFIVIYVGQFSHRKGIERLSDALNRIDDPSIKALFLGRGSLKADYRGTLSHMTVPHAELPDYLCCADVFVLPTLNEGCSNAIIEALACGLPVISSNREFNLDLLNDSNSILVDPENVDAIADAIKRLKGDAKLMNKMRSNILTGTNYSLDKRARNILQIITKYH
jgi:teichuronic acid biosynthesis glycosyltransferase TuaC